MKNIVARRNVHRFELDCLDNLDRKLHPEPKTEKIQAKPLSKSAKFYHMAKDAMQEWMNSFVRPAPQLVPVRVEPARVVFSGSPASASSPSRFGPRSKRR